MADITSNIVNYLAGFLFVIPALTLHEWAHAYMANRLGDPTPRMLGRLSLNPLKHIDPFGTVLMPIALLVFSGGQFTFGYAKPVQVNPRYFKDSRHGMLLVGIAGPLMNIVLALISGLLVRLLLLAPGIPPAMHDFFNWLLLIIVRFCIINLVLSFFNLLPIPPFDGSRVVQKYLKGEARRWYAQLERYGMYIILVLVWGVPMLFGFDLVGIYLRYTAYLALSILTGLPWTPM